MEASEKRNLRRYAWLVLAICIFLAVSISLFAGCGSGTPVKESNGGSSSKRNTVRTLLVPEASSINVLNCDSGIIDYSNISDGYFMVRYTGENEKSKVRIYNPDGSMYIYTIKNDGEYKVLPVSCGDGKYKIEFLEHAYDNMYSLETVLDIDVTLKDEFTPFLYPNQFVWYTEDSAVVSFGIDLSENSTSDLHYIQNVYSYVTKRIAYDKQKALEIDVDYIPDADEVLSSKKGICFDYASLMSALLRSQGIPTRLVVGYADTVYHAWISVYLEEVGWVDNMILFDGKDWSIMDPTLAASSSRKDVEKYMNDNSVYSAKYYY